MPGSAGSAIAQRYRLHLPYYWLNQDIQHANFPSAEHPPGQPQPLARGVLLPLGPATDLRSELAWICRPLS